MEDLREIIFLGMVAALLAIIALMDQLRDMIKWGVKTWLKNPE